MIPEQQKIIYSKFLNNFYLNSLNNYQEVVVKNLPFIVLTCLVLSLAK